MTMAVGLIIHGDQAEQILRDKQADLVAVGREILNNPNWRWMRRPNSGWRGRSGTFRRNLAIGWAPVPNGDSGPGLDLAKWAK